MADEMTREEWIRGMDKDEAVFRIARGCDGCAFYLPDEETGKPVCSRPKYEEVCRKDHRVWMAAGMDV